MVELSHRSISVGTHSFPSPFWQAHDADLRRYAEVECLTTTETARRLGVSKNSVIGRAQRIDVAWVRAPEPLPSTPRPAGFPPPGRCVFPYSHPGAPDFAFCSEEVVEVVHPYCADHHLLCYRQMIKKDQRGGAI